MAGTLALNRGGGAPVSTTVGAAFKVLETPIRQLGQLSVRANAGLHTLGQFLEFSTVVPNSSVSEPFKVGGNATELGIENTLERFWPESEKADFKYSVTLLKRAAAHLQVISVKVADIERSLSQGRVGRVSVKISSRAAAQPGVGALKSSQPGAVLPVSASIDPDRPAGTGGGGLAMKAIGDVMQLATGRSAVGITSVGNGFTGLPPTTNLAASDAFGDGNRKGWEGSQRVFVVNAQDFCCGSMYSRERGGGRYKPSRNRPGSPGTRGGWATLQGYLGKAGSAIRSARAPAAIEAGYKVVKTFLTAETAEQKADGYGGAVGGFGGALAGAVVGSFVPVVGSAIGAAIGGIAGSEWGASLAKKWFAGDDSGKAPVVEPTHLSKSLGDVARSMNPGAGEPITMLSLPALPQPLGPVPQPTSQQITFAPHMPITVQGSVSNPAELAMTIEPIVRRQFDEIARMAANRQLADPTFV